MEAAAIELKGRDFSNVLMTRHFWWYPLSCWRFTPLAVFTDIPLSPRHTPSVVKRFWRRRDTLPAPSMQSRAIKRGTGALVVAATRARAALLTPSRRHTSAAQSRLDIFPVRAQRGRVGNLCLEQIRPRDLYLRTAAESARSRRAG
jgi:hypothetical protein